MRQLVKFPGEAEARRLGDYLVSMDIGTRVDPTPDGWIVWVYDDNKLPLAVEEKAGFLADPADPRYDDAAAVARAKRNAEEAAERLHRKNTVNLNGRLGQVTWRRRPLTVALIAASVVATLGTNFGHDTAKFLLVSFSAFRLTEGGYVSDGPDGLDAIRRGQLWRLVTPIFVHLNVLHILFNMSWLNSLGTAVEMRKGAARLGVLVLASAVLSNTAQYLWVGPMSLFGGMSGVVYAVFGYVWIKGQFDPADGLGASSNAVTIMVLWLFLCMTGLLGPIANAAHVAGLLVGMVFGFLRY